MLRIIGFGFRINSSVAVSGNSVFVAPVGVGTVRVGVRVFVPVVGVGACVVTCSKTGFATPPKSCS